MHPDLQNYYCGPAALCIISGGKRDPSDIVEDVNIHRGVHTDKRVVGMYTGEMLAILRDMGYTHRIMKLHPNRYTVRSFVEKHFTGIYLIVTSGHFMVARHGFIHDNWRPWGQDICEPRVKYARARLVEAYEILEV